MILEASFWLSRGEREQILKRVEKLTAARRAKQPLEYPSAGSVFRRPEGHFAGALIEAAGMKGYRIGDMMISEKHAGFLINAGEGAAADAVRVIRDVQERVRETSGVSLVPEVKLVGDFGGLSALD